MLRLEKRAVIPGEKKIVEGVSLERISRNLRALEGQVLGFTQQICSPEKEISSEGEKLACPRHNDYSHEEKQKKSCEKTKNISEECHKVPLFLFYRRRNDRYTSCHYT